MSRQHQNHHHPDKNIDMNISKLRQQRLKVAVWRDVVFLVGGAIAYAIVGYVETHAADADIRLKSIQLYTTIDGVCTESSDTCANDNVWYDNNNAAPKKRILDAGFILTSPMHSYLKRNRDVNDLLAMANSFLLTIPLAYVVYVTLWRGDFRLSFRLIATHLFRSLCGWFTYLPPDPEFLSSFYDFPEIILCLFQECSSHHNSQVNFLTFFSGHVATIVIIANHLYRSKCPRISILLHCFNWLQIFRLLSTRGHYSIDLIIGYVVAVFVSNPAERLGFYYSKGMLQPSSLPGIAETFEILIGVSVSEVMRHDDDDDDDDDDLRTHNVANDYEKKTRTTRATNSSSCVDTHTVQSETSVRIAMEIVAEILPR